MHTINLLTRDVFLQEKIRVKIFTKGFGFSKYKKFNINTLPDKMNYFLFGCCAQRKNTDR